MKNILRLNAVVQLFTALLVIIYWISYFTLVEDTISNEIVVAHEKAFPVPDLGFLLPCLILGGIGLLLRRSFGILFTLLAGGAMVFLSLLDSTFGLMQGLINFSTIEGISYAFIALYLIGFGIFLIWSSWTNRENILKR